MGLCIGCYGIFVLSCVIDVFLEHKACEACYSGNRSYRYCINKGINQFSAIVAVCCKPVQLRYNSGTANKTAGCICGQNPKKKKKKAEIAVKHPPKNAVRVSRIGIMSPADLPQRRTMQLPQRISKKPRALIIDILGS